MRVIGLHLHAYGHFTGHSLDFGPAPGLHLVYGNNEAGKSTTLRALSSVLFGYPHDVVDGFKHDTKDIAIGVDLLASDGRRLSFVRRRRGKHALTAAGGSALDEGTVERFLGGVSRDVFEKVFALDHHRLHEHARALLADGGSLGFSLAEAGSGIAGLKAVLDKLKAERAALFLAGGSKPKLNQAISQVSELRKEARRRTVSPTDYRSREKRIQEVDAELQGMRNRRKAIESNTIRLQRIGRNLPLRAEHRALTRRIEALDDVPMLPPQFAQQRVKTQADLDAAREDINVTSAAVEELERCIAAIALDGAILARSEEIERLAQKRPIIEKNETDSPKREAERTQLYATIADLLAKAELSGGPENLAGMLPSALKRKAILKLADAGKELDTQRATALKNAETEARALNKARDRATQTPEPRPVGDLARALTAADKLGYITADIAKRTRMLERKTKALSETIIGLGLGTDRVSVLRELAVPPEKAVTRYAELLAVVDKEMTAARETRERLNGDVAAIDQSIAALKAVGGVATEDDLKAARQARDQGWSLVRGLYVERQAGLEDLAHRYAPDGRIADTYERQVREADQSVDIMRAHVQESTELSLLRRRKADLGAKTTEMMAAVNALDIRRETVLSEWRALWPTGLITVQLPGEMIEWLARRSAAIAAADLLADERDAIMELVDKERDARQTLAAAMEAFALVPPERGLEPLRERARDILGDVAKANTLHEKAEEAVRVQSARKIDADEAANKFKSRIEDWKAAWRGALAEAGLPPGLTIEAASATLEIMNELDLVKSKVDELTHRIEAMGHDRDAFRDALAAMTTTLRGAPAGTAAETCRWLEKRLGVARRAETELKGLADQLEIQTIARDRANDKFRRSRATLDVLCAQAGCTNADELAEIERKSTEKQNALSAREKIETRVREDGGGRDFAALFEECEDAPADQIPADILSLKVDRENTEAYIEKLMSDRAALQAEFDSLLAQNQAADLMQEAATVEAEIADTVEAYVDLTVQETLLRAAIDIYRDRNQGPILMRAKGLFAELTDGAYTGLRADINERGETILIAEDALRGSLEIDALSDGTVDPLYLALRLAVVQEHNAAHEPLPFIGDDLLLNLDDKRAQAALRTLAAIAASSQVLLFTHHAHMVDLARIAVPPPILVEHNLSSAINAARAAKIAV
ncbi:MAG TPA: AAA family ATPase [Xanthobacteraceae bacterium]|nr:AAA family ATPase [Xanthobacteraceae bacterium]